MTVPVTREMLERVSEALQDFSSGTLRVSGAEARHGADSEGNPSVRIVALVDPPRGQDGWDVDDVLALQSRAEELLRREEPEAPWALVELRSSEDQASDELSAEEDDVEGALREALGD